MRDWSNTDQKIRIPEGMQSRTRIPDPFVNPL
jgi:hypothetical protein